MFVCELGPCWACPYNNSTTSHNLRECVESSTCVKGQSSLSIMRKRHTRALQRFHICTQMPFNCRLLFWPTQCKCILGRSHTTVGKMPSNHIYHPILRNGSNRQIIQIIRSSLLLNKRHRAPLRPLRECACNQRIPLVCTIGIHSNLRISNMTIGVRI